MLCATGATGVDATGNGEFETALHEVMLDLSHQVVRDGEGATKFVEIQISGAANDTDAKTHAMAIANSPLRSGLTRRKLDDAIGKMEAAGHQFTKNNANHYSITLEEAHLTFPSRPKTKTSPLTAFTIAFCGTVCVLI